MSLLSQGGERLRVLRQILRMRAIVDPFEIKVHQVSYKKKRTLMFVYLFFITIKHATRVGTNGARPALFYNIQGLKCF